MYYIIYSSYATQPFDDERLKDLLIQSRDKNSSIGITGMLFYFDDKFIQLIEGEEQVVKELSDKIAKDNRHEYFVILKEGEIVDRYFADWSMGFKSIDPNNFVAVEQFKDLNSSTNLETNSFVYLMNILSENG
jgi:hypothetical protein